MTLNQDQEKTLGKVKKLLALAGDNSNASEAENALLKAQSLLAEAGLSMSDTDEFDTENTKQIAHEEATEFSENTEWWVKTLAGLLAINFRCVAYVNTTPAGWSQVRFMGLREDVDICKEIFMFAVRAVEYNAEQYLKNSKLYGRRAIFSFESLLFSGAKQSEPTEARQRTDYIIGFLHGLDQKFQEQIQRNNWGLVLVKDDLVQREEARMEMGKEIPDDMPTEVGDADALRRGMRDGYNWDRPKGQIEEGGS